MKQNWFFKKKIIKINKLLGNTLHRKHKLSIIRNDMGYHYGFCRHQKLSNKGKLQTTLYTEI